MAVKVLLVDDEVSVLNALRCVLRGEDYELLTARNGQEALDIIADIDVGVIICDHRMVGMNGIEVLEGAVKRRPDAVRIMLTGHIDLRGAQAAINQGQVGHFLLKPWDDEHLRVVVREAASHYEMRREIQHLCELARRQRDELEEWSRQLEERVSDRTAALQADYAETLDALVLALDTREYGTPGHSRRVAVHCLYLALEVGIPQDELEDLYRGALLHDIGKIGVPDAVLLKPGPLDPREREIIEQHVSIGVQILERTSCLKTALSIPRYHHERYDGDGYSERLRGEAIPIQARIFAVIDMYDALRNARPWKEAMSHEEAIQIIGVAAGNHFDPGVTSSFVAIPGSICDSLAAASQEISRYDNALPFCEKLRAGTHRQVRNEAQLRSVGAPR